MLHFLVLYDSPKDSPGKWVVREQWVAAGSWEIHHAPIAFLFSSRARAERWLSEGYHPLGRQPEDDPVIVGAWI